MIGHRQLRRTKKTRWNSNLALIWISVPHEAQCNICWIMESNFDFEHPMLKREEYFSIFQIYSLFPFTHTHTHTHTKLHSKLRNFSKFYWKFSFFFFFFFGQKKDHLVRTRDFLNQVFGHTHLPSLRLICLLAVVVGSWIWIFSFQLLGIIKLALAKIKIGLKYPFFSHFFPCLL